MSRKAEEIHAELRRCLLEISSYARVISGDGASIATDIGARSLAVKITDELRTANSLLDQLRQREVQIGAARHLLEGI